MTTANDLAKRLRQKSRRYRIQGESEPLKDSTLEAAADLIDSQAARIAELEPLAKEIERLKGFETAYKIWSEKTDWVQNEMERSEKTLGPILGMHRADVMTKTIESQEREIIRLESDLAAVRRELEAVKEKFELQDISHRAAIYSYDIVRHELEKLQAECPRIGQPAAQCDGGGSEKEPNSQKMQPTD